MDCDTFTLVTLGVLVISLAIVLFNSYMMPGC